MMKQHKEVYRTLLFTESEAQLFHYVLLQSIISQLVYTCMDVLDLLYSKNLIKVTDYKFNCK